MKRHQQHSKLQELILKHFRPAIAADPDSPKKFFSLPRAFLEKTPVQGLGLAACSAVMRASDNIPALLPLRDRQPAQDLLALQDAADVAAGSSRDMSSDIPDRSHVVNDSQQHDIAKQTDVQVGSTFELSSLRQLKEGSSQ